MNQHSDEHKKKIYLETNLQIIFGITLMAVMGVASITPAFPNIIQALGISSTRIGLLITVFTFPGIILTPVLGVFADRYGRKRILIPSMFLFGIAGGACALSRDFNLLLIMRFFQGIGAASLGAINVTIIGDLYSGRERAAAMGYNASILSVGTASYPAIGGALAMVGWYWPFILPLLAIPLGFVVLFFLKNPEPKTEQHLKDYFRNVLKSLKSRQVIGIFVASVVTFIILYGPLLTYLPLLMADSFGTSPLVIGLFISVMSLTTAFTSSQLGKLTKKFSEQTLLKTTFLLYGLAIFLIPFLPKLTAFLIPAVIFGIAHGLNIPCFQTLLAGLAPMEYRGAFMSLNGMVLRLGQTLGPVLMGIIFGLWGIGATFFAGAALAGLMFLFGVVMIK
jgi:MFS transporter, ACDE family, multidrug resistance protein